VEKRLLLRPKLVDRELEMGKLTKAMESAMAGNGSTIFISGEAGVGKTRIVQELIKEAKTKDFRIMTGQCFTESLEPLMPIKNALKEVGLPHLISGDPPPLLISSYLVNDSGLLMARSEIGDINLDSDIFSAMLRAIGEFVKDSMRMVDESSKAGKLNVLGYGDFKIIMEEDRGLHLACVVKGGFSELLITDMKEVLADAWRQFGTIIEKWEGDMAQMEGFEAILSKFVKSGKYSGKFLVEDPKLKRENLYDNVLLGIQRLSLERPVILFIDDLHNADATTLNLLHYLARNIRTSRVLILGTYRPEDLIHPDYGKVHPLERTMQDMGQEDSFERLELHRLDMEGTRKVMCSALRGLSVEGVFLEKIHTETGGTPLFVLELLKMLVEEGAMLKNEEDEWTFTSKFEKVELPTKIYEVVRRRLDRLHKEQHDILECGAVIGDSFPAEIIVKLTGLSRITVLRNLAEIENSHRLIHSSARTYFFDHTKIREVLYNGIMEELREEYHRMIAEFIEASASPDRVLSELAYHYQKANDARAGPYLVKSGDSARERFFNQEAINAYRNSLAFLPQQQKSDVMEKLADLQVVSGVYDEAINFYKTINDSAVDGTTKARMLRKTAEVFLNKGDFESALSILGTAKKLVSEDDVELGRLLFGEGRALQRKGHNEKGLARLQEALAVYSRVGEQKDVGEALRAIGIIYWNNSDFAKALQYYKHSLSIMESIKDEQGTAAALVNMGIVYHNQGNLDLALDHYGRCLGINEKIGNQAGIGGVLANIGLAHWDRGELEVSLGYQTKSLRIFEKIGYSVGIANSLGNISLAQRDLGELEKALENQKMSYALREKMGDQSGMALALINIGEIFKDKGDLDKAMEHYRKSLDICIEIKDKLVSIHNLRGMAEVCACQGDANAALDYARKAVQTSVEIGARSQEGVSRRVLGTVLSKLKDNNGAMDEYNKAEDILTEIGDMKEKAILIFEKASLLSIAGKKTKAKDEFGNALAEFERMGMRPWAEKCRKAMAGD